MNSQSIDTLTSQNRRRRLLKKIEELRSSRVVTYISLAPLDDGVLIPLYQELRRIGCVDRLDLILHSFGGNIDTPYKVVKMVRDFCESFSVLVPVAAKSAASMIALGADQIVMGPFAELGPIDPIVRHPLYGEMWISVQALQHFCEYLGEKAEQNTPYCLNMFEKIDPWLFGDYAKTLQASRQYAELLLNEYMFKEKDDASQSPEAVVDKLLNGYFSHGYPITKHEAKSLGLKVVDESPDLSDTLLELFLEYDHLLQ
jgi:hypothetical protein